MVMLERCIKRCSKRLAGSAKYESLLKPSSSAFVIYEPFVGPSALEIQLQSMLVGNLDSIA